MQNNSVDLSTAMHMNVFDRLLQRLTALSVRSDLERSCGLFHPRMQNVMPASSDASALIPFC